MLSNFIYYNTSNHQLNHPYNITPKINIMIKFKISPNQLILLSFGLISILKHISLFTNEFIIYESKTVIKCECLEA